MATTPPAAPAQPSLLETVLDISVITDSFSAAATATLALLTPALPALPALPGLPDIGGLLKTLQGVEHTVVELLNGLLSLSTTLPNPAASGLPADLLQLAGETTGIAPSAEGGLSLGLGLVPESTLGDVQHALLGGSVTGLFISDTTAGADIADGLSLTSLTELAPAPISSLVTSALHPQGLVGTVVGAVPLPV